MSSSISKLMAHLYYVSDASGKYLEDIPHSYEAHCLMRMTGRVLTYCMGREGSLVLERSEELLEVGAEEVGCVHMRN